MAKLIIEKVPGANGEYDFDFDERPFTNGELHLIKEVARVRGGEIEEAFEKGDNDLLVALGLIVLKRNGRDVPVDALWDAPAGCLRFEFDEAEPEAENDAVPPKIAPVASETDDGKSGSSGSSSNGAGDAPQETIPLSTGVQR